MRMYVLLLVTCLAQGLSAAARPTHPAPGVDTVLLGSSSPRDFFARRAMDEACQQDLREAELEYSELLAEVEMLKGTGPANQLPADVLQKIDGLEVELRKRRKKMLGFVAQCGICAMQDVQRIEVPSAIRTEIWYVSDGSCQLPSEDPAELKAVFNRLSDSLVQAGRYPHYQQGGFANILEFLVVDPATGQVTQQSRFPASPVNLMVAVLGPTLVKPLPLSFEYYISAHYEKKATADGGEEFLLTFSAEKPPTGFKFPTVIHQRLNGKRRSVSSFPLRNVIGQWYLNSDGYIRYYTGAEFPASMKFLEELGRAILIETLTEMVERSRQP